MLAFETLRHVLRGVLGPDGVLLTAGIVAGAAFLITCFPDFFAGLVVGLVYLVLYLLFVGIIWVEVVVPLFPRLDEAWSLGVAALIALIPGALGAAWGAARQALNDLHTLAHPPSPPSPPK